MKSGDIFASQAQVLINPVNCVGVMGKGIALQFKQRYPNMMSTYQAGCANGEVAIGHVQYIRYDDQRWIVNFPTKDQWRKPSQLTYIEAGLGNFVRQARNAFKSSRHHLTTYAFPPLGCGLGGLEWDGVLPIMLAAFEQLSDLALTIEIYGPQVEQKFLRLIIAGSRSFTDYQLLCEKVDAFQQEHGPVVEVICGMARGADTLGSRYAREHKIPVKKMPADWDRYGKGAGYRRNEEMAQVADAHLIRGGHS
jgi:O-acetyl-ADP-ribose deacetylase (regulator of RNase III)